MDQSAVFLARLFTFAAAVSCLVIMLAAGHELQARLLGVAAHRPAADAPVGVVRAPADLASDRTAAGACLTCAMGAPRGGL
jgi:hypothetical protein